MALTGFCNHSIRTETDALRLTATAHRADSEMSSRSHSASGGNSNKITSSAKPSSATREGRSASGSSQKAKASSGKQPDEMDIDPQRCVVKFASKQSVNDGGANVLRLVRIQTRPARLEASRARSLTPSNIFHATRGRRALSARASRASHPPSWLSSCGSRTRHIRKRRRSERLQQQSSQPP